MGLFFFLGSVFLICALWPVWLIIGILLWKARYVILAITVPIVLFFIWGCYNNWHDGEVAHQRWEQQLMHRN